MDQIYYEKKYYRFQWQWQKAFIIYFFFILLKKILNNYGLRETSSTYESESLF